MNAQNSDKLNRGQSKPLDYFSNFRDSLPYRFANTYRFGEIGVHYAADVVPSENGTLRNSHVLRSYTLENPLLQSFKMRKTYGLIPLSAILPLNYEKYILIPNRGEDVNAKLIGTSVEGFIGKLQEFARWFSNRVSSEIGSSDDDATWVFRFVIFYDMMFSRGSLLKSLGCTLTNTNATPDSDVDFFWDSVVNQFDDSDWYFKLTIRDKSWYVGGHSVEMGIGHISLREAISRMRDDLSFTVEWHSLGELPWSTVTWSALDSQSVDTAPVDLSRCFGYQIFCAHFFSNDHVDSIYSAELWRQNLYSLVRRLMGEDADVTFSWNGVNYRYDVCSAYIVGHMFDLASEGDFNSVQLIGLFLDYLRLIFGYNRSLVRDYFTGSRTLPLAPGDVQVSVNGSSFNVVESIQKSWYARLFAQIQRVGRRISEQSKALFPDVNDVQDWHDPVWLGETASDVFAEEVDNTGAQMYEKSMSTITVLRSNQESMAFELRVPDRYGVVIGFTWFDIARFYPNATDRTFFHVTRFDRFNPYLQFNGDQPIYLKELTSDAHSLPDQYFGYTGRYMEYKQNYNKCAGGFADETLPGLIFKADEGKDFADITNLNSDYIRSYPSELDRFYLRLSGWSLGHYFHFMCINTNMYDGNKPMAVNPTLD